MHFTRRSICLRCDACDQAAALQRPIPGTGWGQSSEMGGRSCSGPRVVSPMQSIRSAERQPSPRPEQPDRSHLWGLRVSPDPELCDPRGRVSVPARGPGPIHPGGARGRPWQRRMSHTGRRAAPEAAPRPTYTATLFSSRTRRRAARTRRPPGGAAARRAAGGLARGVRPRRGSRPAGPLSPSLNPSPAGAASNGTALPASRRSATPRLR